MKVKDILKFKSFNSSERNRLFFKERLLNKLPVNKVKKKSTAFLPTKVYCFLTAYPVPLLLSLFHWSIKTFSFYKHMLKSIAEELIPQEELCILKVEAAARL